MNLLSSVSFYHKLVFANSRVKNMYTLLSLKTSDVRFYSFINLSHYLNIGLFELASTNFSLLYFFTVVNP